MVIAGTEFAEHFGRDCQDPTTNLSVSSATGASASTHEFEEYQQLKAHGRRAFHINELPDEIADAIEKAATTLNANTIEAMKAARYGEVVTAGFPEVLPRSPNSED